MELNLPEAIVMTTPQTVLQPTNTFLRFLHDGYYWHRLLAYVGYFQADSYTYTNERPECIVARHLNFFV